MGAQIVVKNVLNTFKEAKLYIPLSKLLPQRTCSNDPDMLSSRRALAAILDSAQAAWQGNLHKSMFLGMRLREREKVCRILHHS